MRVATLFKRLLRLGRERVVRVTLFEGAEEQVLVELERPERRRMRCPCGPPAGRRLWPPPPRWPPPGFGVRGSGTGG